MQEYIDKPLVQSSIEFLIDEINEGGDYNLFVYYDDCEAQWKRKLNSKRILNSASSDDDDLWLNRLKLSFILSRFHLAAIARPSILALDKSYLSSHDFVKDYAKLSDLIQTEILTYIHGKYRSSIHFRYFRFKLNSIFKLSSSFSVPLPLTSYKSNYSSLINNYNPTVLDKYCLIHPNLNDVSLRITQDLMINFKLDIKKINENGYGNNYFSTSRYDMMMAAEQAIEPILEYFRPSVGNFSFEREDYHNNLSIPNYTICFDKDNVRLRIPIEFRIKGIKNVIDQGNGNSINQILIQVSYQMLETASDVALIIENEFIIVLKITHENYNSKINVSRIGNDLVYPINFDFAIFEHGSRVSLTAIMATIINSRMVNIDQDINVKMEKLRSWVQKADVEIKRDDNERYKIVEDFYKVNFKKFKFNKVKKEYKNSEFEIPKAYHIRLRNLENSYRTIPERQFKIVLILQDVTEKTRDQFNSQVVLVRYIGPGVNHNKLFVLKVYNPVFRRSSESSCQNELNKALVFALTMHQREIDAFKILTKENPQGISMLVPNSTEHNNGYIPYILDYGYLKWKSPLIGYYILEQYLAEDTSRITKDEAWILAERALKYLHNKGLLHGNIKRSHIIYANGQIYFIDFGQCRLSKFSYDEYNIDFELAKKFEMDTLKRIIDNEW
ncbi:uncharacterized protein RJT21DRAFT_37810 [Scheffersomyces amazonensis]|uniref:uncharacterized protein n=1 Tax=Scheffersomyces amazonensis TaxID=1078765 RepID=UPI00315C6230